MIKPLLCFVVADIEDGCYIVANIAQDPDLIVDQLGLDSLVQCCHWPETAGVQCAKGSVRG